MTPMRPGRQQRQHRATADVDFGIPGYTVTRPLGEGTFAVVYAARKAGLDREVAIKVMKARGADDDVRARMASELDATVRLSRHPNIVDVYDAGTTSAGDPYMVMRLEPQTLADRLVDYGFSWQEAVGIGVKISGALETAHRGDLLHRDVKPQNILLSEYGDPKLADFGVAQALAAAGGLAQEHVFTPYSAPEVVIGGPHSELTDVYSLAATIHTMIAGTPPFGFGGEEGGDLALAAAISTGPLPDLRQKPLSVPSPVADVLGRAMSKNPEKRPQSALDFGRALVAAARKSGETVSDPVVGPAAAETQQANEIRSAELAGRVVSQPLRHGTRGTRREAVRGLLRQGRWWSSRHRRGMLALATGLAAVGLVGGVLLHGVQRERNGAAPVWTPRASMPIGRAWVGTATAGDERIYAVGGLGSANQALSTVEAYDPRTDRWRGAPDLQTGRWAAAVTAASDGKLYAIGGFANGQLLGSVEVASPGGAWTNIAPLPTPRWAAAAVGDRNGRVYVLGGFATEDAHHAVATVDVYSPATNTWSQAAPMPSARGALAAVAAPNGDIYTLGGSDGPELASVDIYDPDTDSWTAGPPLPLARSAVGAAIDADGRVYAIGGYAHRHAVGEVDVFVPGSRAWTPSKALPLPVYAPVANTPDGRIFVIGGATDTRGLARVWELVSAANP